MALHRLRWELQLHGSFYGQSGSLTVAMVVPLSESGRWNWSTRDMSTKWLCASAGEVAQASAGRRAAERAWSRWLEAAQLTEKEI